MKHISLFSLLLTFLFLGNSPLSAQMVGDNVFLPGHWVEVGIAPNGSLGSTRGAPTGYNPYMGTSFSLYDPALGSSAFVTDALMMVYDAGHDGWTTGSPPFFGDYSMPGTPYEGWGIEINGTHSEAQFQYYTGGGTPSGFSGGSLTGTSASYSNPIGQLVGVWSGSAASGALQITQTTTLDTNASWVVMNVKLKNVGGTSLANVYYDRETDPDNDVARGGSYSTRNVIDYQNDYAHRVQVTGWGTVYTTQSLSLSTKDCRAVCYIHSGWPMSTGTSLSTLWTKSGSGFTFTGSITNDYAIGIVWNLGTIAAGDSTMLTYAYVFNGSLGLDSAMLSPKLVTLGTAHDSTDTVTSCLFSGDTLYASIINASTANWAGSVWTWAPSSSLLTSTGVSNGVLLSALTTTTTYTITGVNPSYGTCDSVHFYLTVTPKAGPSPPIVRDTSYCLGATAVPLTAVGVSLLWYTGPTGGVGSTTAPTPSTGTIGTTTYYVSQTIAGCESARTPINVTILALPSTITGTKSVCIGLTTTLSDATTGGTWSSSLTGVATIGSTSGVVTGVTSGTTIISYSVSSGCSITSTFTVYPLPSVITGVTTVCAGATTTLFDAGGGTWTSGTTSVATVGVSTGVVTGVAPGTSVITYTLATGCIRTTTVTVMPSPAAILGTPAVCIGSSTTLSDVTSGGVWTSTDGTIATIGSSTGVVTGVLSSTVILSYTLAGCAATVTMTVNPLPSPITGVTNVCVGQTTTLFDPGGGTWSSSTTTVATVGLTTGTVTGVTTGTSIITYTLPTGCMTSVTVTVSPNPTAILGTLAICQGGTTTLSDAVPSGTWSSSLPAIASVGLTTGLVTGVSAGTTTITYKITTGCFATAVFTVNALPSTITGVTKMCIGYSTSLTDAVPGGSWSSSNTSVAIIGSSTGIATGMALGTATITYTLPTGCFITTSVTVNSLPSAITGATTVCVGATTALSDATGGGIWTSSATTIATVSGTGVVTGVSSGTAVITYTVFSTGCFATTTVTVGPAPGPISGVTGVCVGSTTTLSDAVSGGGWSSSNTAVATIGFSTGVVTGVTVGTATITYSLGGSCKVTTTVTILPLPAAIGGTPTVCVGSTTTLTGAGGGTWTSGTTTVATIGLSTGVVTGVAAGTSTITYTATTGCSVTKVVTVNPLPTGILGLTTVCIGATGTLSDATAGGTWSSSNTAIVTVGLSTGVITGIAGGTATITYKLTSTGCAITTVATVTSSPPAITGAASICIGATTTLSNPVSGGVWSSSNTTIATIGSATGIVTGLSAGTTTITYLPGSGCAATKVVTVNPFPGPISGPGSVCVGATMILTDAGGGTWTSSATTIATIGLSTGMVTGVALGTTVITYTLPTGCITTTTVTVSPSPGPISGVSTMCVGDVSTLSDAVGGGVWTSGTTTVATIGSLAGDVTAVGPGTTIITYSLGSSCVVNKTITVSLSPSAISGGTIICVGTTSALSNGVSGGSWSSSNTVVATVGISSGVVTGMGPGTATITYAMGSGCIATLVVTISPSPGVITGSKSLCIGSTSTLVNLASGGTWTSSNTAVATIGSTSGTVTGISTGTSVITYSVGAGCYTTTTVTVSSGPLPITGTGTVCIGNTTTLSDPTPGGTWSSSVTTVATVNSTGVVTGVIAGTAVIMYSLGCITTMTVTVSASPSPIIGVASMCNGATVTMSDAVTGGVWSSSNTAVAVIGASSGMATAVAAGVWICDYTIGTGCNVTKSVTVNPIAPITGSTSLCTGLTTTLSDAVPGGTWSSSNTLVATVTPGGIVTGVSSGTSTIIYIMPTGCSATLVVTVNSVPAPITGVAQVCKGQTTALSDATTGGLWSSSNTTIATITAGVVTGIAAGTTTITYSLGSGCTVVTVVTVNPLPGLISGSSNVCMGSTITLSNPTTGGTWSSSNTLVAIVSTGGVVSGGLAGSATITYTLSTGCSVSKLINVNPVPAPISGTTSLCVGQTTTLSDVGGGTWTSSKPTTASVGLTTGVVSGVVSGTATMTYTSGGCSVTTTVTVVPSPTAIGGSTAVCVGQTGLLTNGSPGGVWLSANTSIATIGASSGVVTGVSSGTVLIYYTLGTGCSIFTTIIVNPISPIIGSSTVCAGQSISLLDTTLGGTWSSVTPAIASVGLTTGIVTGGTSGSTLIIYTTPKACTASHLVTVAASPAAITGTAHVCVGQTTTLSDATAGGTWSSANTIIADVNPTGVVTGYAAGLVTISYMVGGCAAMTTVTVDGLPAAISGVTDVCVGSTTTLASSGGGLWSSSNTTIASVLFSSGVVTGVAPGTATIAYILTTGCKTTAIVTVNPLPPAITGSSNLCIGSTTTMSDAVAGGSWTSSNTLVAVINPSTGDVTGITTGTTTITYTLPTGCSVSMILVVNSLPPAISGSANVCVGSTTTLSDIGGGTWSSSVTTVATVSLTGGVVSGITAGTSTVIYTLGTGCVASTVITVDPLPAAITGFTQVCVGYTTMLSDATSGGDWSSGSTTIATISSSGVVTGITPGTSTIAYTLGTGCLVTETVVVSPTPSAIIGNAIVCLGSSYVFTDLVPGGTWASSNTAVATVGLGTGLVTGLTLGTSVIDYTLSAGCSASMTISVVPLPTVYTVTGGGNYCSGGAGVHVGLNGSVVGTNYFLYVGGKKATGPLAGTGSAIDFGSQTVGGTYTVIATNTFSGCSSNMAGSALIVVNPTVIPTIKVAAGAGDTICAGVTTVFTYTSTGGGTAPIYVWDVNGVAVSFGTSYSFIPADSDVVAITMTSNAVCATPAIVHSSIKMNVIEPKMPSAVLSTYPGDTVCQGLPVTLNAEPTFGGSAPTYAWVVNGATVGAGASFTYVPMNKDVVFCWMTSNYRCTVKNTVASNNVVMTVDSAIIPHVTIAADPGTSVGLGQTVTLTANVTDGGLSPTYQWFKNGLPITGATNNVYKSNTYSLAPEDTMSVVVTSSGICSMTTHQWVYISVHKLGVNTITAGGELAVVPNPNKGEFTIKGSLNTGTDDPVAMEVADLLGQVVYRTTVAVKNGIVNEHIKLGTTVANGMYILTVHSATGSQVFHMVIEQ